MTSKGPDAAYERITVKQSSPPTPTLKMKRVFTYVDRSKPGVLSFKNSEDREILTLTIPPNKHFDCVDVHLGPDAKLDEIATVIAKMMADIIFLSTPH